MGEILTHIRDSFLEFRAWTLQQLRDFALNVARRVDITQDGSVSDGMRLFVRELVIGTIDLNSFITMCENVLEAIVVNVLLHPAVIEACKKSVQFCIDQFIANPAVNQVCNDVFVTMLKRAHEALAKRLSGSALKEVLSGTAAAKSAAKSAFVSAAVVNVALFGISTAYSQYQYQNGIITREERNKHVTKRAVATGGSIAGTTAGALVGTAIFPVVGTFLGGVIGGMAGDFFGSKAGEATYDRFAN